MESGGAGIDSYIPLYKYYVEWVFDVVDLLMPPQLGKAYLNRKIPGWRRWWS
jgi:hypothetical protein